MGGIIIRIYLYNKVIPQFIHARMYNAYTVTEKVITSISVKLYYESSAGINTENKY
jgi:hypothetical protein